MCGIYKYENLINHMIYIGQAIDLKERYNKHRRNMADLNHQEDIYQAFREFGLDNFSYEILEQFENFDQQLLNERECYYIEYFNSLTPNGYNMVPGGTNGAGLAKGKEVEQYDLMGHFITSYPSAHQAQTITGISYSSICACCRNEISHTKEYQWKYANSDKTIQDISQEKIKILQRPIYQFDLKGQFIQVYTSLQEASIQTGISKSLISNVCNLKGNTAGGYVWSYNDSMAQTRIKTKNRPVEQYDKNMVLLQTFSSLSEAAQQTKTAVANIQSVCAGRRKTANGYIWKYKNN